MSVADGALDAPVFTRGRRQVAGWVALAELPPLSSRFSASEIAPSPTAEWPLTTGGGVGTDEVASHSAVAERLDSGQ